MVMMKKVTDRGFLAFWPFENEQKFRRKRKNGVKNLKFNFPVNQTIAHFNQKSRPNVL